VSFERFPFIAAGAAQVASPDGTATLPPDLFAEYASIVLLNPEPPELELWTRRLARKLARRAEARPWTVLRVTPGMERRVRDALKDRGLEVYVPMEKYRPARTWKSRTRPLLPGYAFANIAGDDDLDLARSNEAVTVMCRTGADGRSRPVTVPALVIGSLILWEWSGAFDLTWSAPAPANRRRTKRPPRHKWAKGEQARVAGGPFEGFMAEIVSADRADRMRALVKLFGRVTDVWLDEDMLEKLA
jgi:transcription antitermination factor NusG